MRMTSIPPAHVGAHPTTKQPPATLQAKGPATQYTMGTTAGAHTPAHNMTDTRNGTPPKTINLNNLQLTAHMHRLESVASHVCHGAPCMVPINNPSIDQLARHCAHALTITCCTPAGAPCTVPRVDMQHLLTNACTDLQVVQTDWCWGHHARCPASACSI